MNIEEILIIAGNMEVLTYLLPLGLFIGFYAARSPWTESPLGKALMYQKASFTLVILVIIASIFFPGYMGRGIVRVLVYGAVGVSIWIDFANLLIYQRIARQVKSTKAQKFLPDEVTKDKKPRKR